MGEEAVPPQSFRIQKLVHLDGIAGLSEGHEAMDLVDQRRRLPICVQPQVLSTALIPAPEPDLATGSGVGALLLVFFTNRGLLPVLSIFPGGP